MKNKKIMIIIIISISLVISLAFGYIKVLKPYNEAVNNYNKVVKVINKQNKQLDEKVAKINKLIDSKEKGANTWKRKNLSFPLWIGLIIKLC